MNIIRINAYAKVNLSIDILGKLPNGYHQVEMVMHQIALHDEVLLRWYPDEEMAGLEIELKTSKPYLPTDERNLAYKAAVLMKEKFAPEIKGVLKIDILKKIPVGGGMAGGSTNGAAVIHGVNVLWGLGENLESLCEVASVLGSDVPFTLMGQAKTNKCLGKSMNNAPLATCCAIAEGTGTELRPLPSIKADILLSKPPVSVSTAQVYQGMRLDELEERPDNKELIEGLEMGNLDLIKKNMINVLEQYTLAAHKEVNETKEKMKEVCPNSTVLMSGSGATVFAIVPNKEEMEKGFKALKKVNKETFITRTTV